MDQGALRLATRSDGRLYTTDIDPTTEAMFSLRESDGRRISSFGNVFSYETMQGRFIGGDGKILNVEDDLLYCSFYHPFMTRFNENGIVVYARALLNDQIDRAENEEEGRPVNMFASGPIQTRGISHVHPRLYLHNDPASRAAGVTVVDAYDAQSGDYEMSLRLPKLARHVDVAQGYIVAIFDTTATVYEIDLRD